MRPLLSMIIAHCDASLRANAKALATRRPLGLIAHC